MTREEQIKEAAKQYCEKFPRGKTASFVSFRAGVEWNEQNQSSVDWQQVRIQAAIAAMQGILASKTMMEIVDKAIKIEESYGKEVSADSAVSNISVGFANALVERLKEE